MTDLLYQTDGYLKVFDAVIQRVDPERRAIVLDRTAFYPGGGGQPCDLGFLRRGSQSYKLEKIKKEAGDVLHFVSPGVDLPQAGETVQGSLEWERRYQLMRTHTALHVLCGTVFRDYGAQVTGGEMEPLKGRMDFEFERMQAGLVHEIEAAVNYEIAQERPLQVRILPREQAFQIPDLIRTKINLLPEGIQFIRTVEIVGLDLQADGGTHVKNTSEIGRVRVVDYKSKGAINKRIYIEVI